MNTRAKGYDRLGLVGFLVLCGVISATGGWVTASSVDTWFKTLVKPAFNPPDWVFAPVWTVLYILIAISGWRVWRQHRFSETAPALIVYAIQLALNLAWSILFFGMQRLDLAAMEIVLLLAMIALNLVMFLRIDKPAGLLLLPYLLWVAFATVLTLRIWQLNG
ncbi:MAG: tryptophan-rich sensory protein [Gammaproteobacteria bacterium]|nr:tryptophan-rich sensory protein [Gammaproteobacteria bacterium]